MSIRSYMKKNQEQQLEAVEMTADELIAKTTPRKISKLGLLMTAFLIVPVVCILVQMVKSQAIQPYDESLVSMSVTPAAVTSAKRGTISIPSGIVKANPFLPYRTIEEDGDGLTDVPKFDLVAPPEVLNEGSDAARVMDTIVSGILYDKFSPSAILNIEGNDYLVKKGDTVNNYKIMDIEQNSVTVKLGSNTFKAGIGEILTEGAVNYNNVSNLNKKFGGERR